MAQWVKPPPVISARHTNIGSVHLQSSSLLMYTGKQQKRAEVLGPLAPTQEIQMQPLGTGLEPLRSEPAARSTSLSLSLPLSNKASQRDKPLKINESHFDDFPQHESKRGRQ